VGHEKQVAGGLVLVAARPAGELLSVTHASQPNEQKTCDLNGNPTGSNIFLGPNNELENP